MRFKDGTQAYLVTVNDPGLYFGTVLREVLIAEGIEVRGEVIRDRSRVLEAAAAIVLHEHRSTLARDLPVILRDSQNLHAEVLLKAIGAASAGLGSVSNGREVVEKVLSRSGISTKGLVIADGSGLSRENRVSPRTLCALLHWVRGREYDSLFRTSLAVAGESGTLRKRYLKSRVRGRVYAKPGYISGVSAL